jgi:hypothetical protein
MVTILCQIDCQGASAWANSRRNARTVVKGLRKCNIKLWSKESICFVFKLGCSRCHLELFSIKSDISILTEIWCEDIYWINWICPRTKIIFLLRVNMVRFNADSGEFQVISSFHSFTFIVDCTSICCYDLESTFKMANFLVQCKCMWSVFNCECKSTSINKTYPTNGRVSYHFTVRQRSIFHSHLAASDSTWKGIILCQFFEVTDCHPSAILSYSLGLMHQVMGWSPALSTGLAREQRTSEETCIRHNMHVEAKLEYCRIA